MSNLPDGSSIQQQQQAIYNQYQTAVNQLQIMNRQLDQISSVIGELQLNISTLIGFMKYSNGSEVIFPIGGLLYFKTNLDKSDEVLLNIGSDTIIPATYEEAKLELEKRLQDMKEVHEKFVTDEQHLQAYVSQLQGQLNQMQ